MTFYLTLSDDQFSLTFIFANMECSDYIDKAHIILFAIRLETPFENVRLKSEKKTRTRSSVSNCYSTSNSYEMNV